MNEGLVTAAVGAIAALLGSLIGAWAVFHADDRRNAKEGASLRLALASDLIRWSEACEYAANDGRRVLLEPAGLAWKDVATSAASHFPRRLFALFVGVQQERDHSELVYHSFATTQNGLSAEEFEQVQFSLRRFVVVAEEFLKEMNAFYGRPWYRRWIPFMRDNGNKGGVEYFTEVAGARVARRLREDFGYDVDDGGSLKSEIVRVERQRALRDEWLRQAGTPSPREDGDGR